MPAPIIQLLMTGNEIMSGDTIDSNSAVIAQRLGQLGLPIHRKVTLGDDAAQLRAELLLMTANADALIINGGLGPTVDDLTAEVLASAAAVPLEEDATARAHIEAWCQRRGVPLNAANLKQAMLPAGCQLLHNPVGSAPGFQLEVNGCLVICTPGVPSELQAMLDTVQASLQARLGSFPERHVLRLQTFGLGESRIQQMIADAHLNWPDTVELGFRAGAPQLEVKLTVADHKALEARQTCLGDLQALFGDHIIGEGDATLADRVLTLLEQQGAAIATAESCTGGLIASMLTQIPGSSSTFRAGYVTYTNEIKMSTLGVSAATLAEHTAVSEPVVRQMAEGALERSGAHYAIAVSGIAGPGGGSPQQPPGTVWLAWGSADDLRTQGLYWPTERRLFQTLVAAAGLDLMRRLLLDIDKEPEYFVQRAQQKR